MAKLTEAGLPVLIAGMLAPPNLGREYGEGFNAIYPRLADKYDAPLYPFFLEGVAMQRALNQGDGIHPNAAGVAELVARSKTPVFSLLEAEALTARPGIGLPATGYSAGAPEAMLFPSRMETGEH